MMNTQQMKKWIMGAGFILGLLALGSLGSSCSRKTGCPAQEVHTELNKKGMPSKPAKSRLFPKKKPRN